MVWDSLNKHQMILGTHQKKSHDSILILRVSIPFSSLGRAEQTDVSVKFSNLSCVTQLLRFFVPGPTFFHPTRVFFLMLFVDFACLLQHNFKSLRFYYVVFFLEIRFKRWSQSDR